eukprot:TRINITY_DN4909_c0_g1_i4.p1 TRINITY_DN4909_c0_g1~~TRINITY_DN4909_c0_g1_i4.p1  ORF type:complete len:369 (+),score=49.71 TRINITY_DN4909_c0_g1_i4:3-1109(+)
MIGMNFLRFVATSIISVVLGIAIAIFLSLILKHMHIGRFPALETIFMLFFCYMSYVLAEGLSLSPIVSVFFCGIVFNHYGAYSLSPYTKLTSRQLFRTLAFICETSVFIYIGITLPTMELDISIPLLIWVFIFCLIARAAHVLPICWFLNKVDKKHPISRPVMMVLWFSGLRGAIAFSLALDTESEFSGHIKTVVLLLVHLTLLVFGCGTMPLLRVMKVQSSQTDQSLDNIVKVPTKSASSRTSQLSRKDRFYHGLDSQYFKKWFRRKGVPISNEAVGLFERLVDQTANDSVQELQIRINGVEYTSLNRDKSPFLSSDSSFVQDEVPDPLLLSSSTDALVTQQQEPSNSNIIINSDNNASSSSSSGNK